MAVLPSLDRKGPGLTLISPPPPGRLIRIETRSVEAAASVRVKLPSPNARVEAVASVVSLMAVTLQLPQAAPGAPVIVTEGGDPCGRPMKIRSGLTSDGGVGSTVVN